MYATGNLENSTGLKDIQFKNILLRRNIAFCFAFFLSCGNIFTQESVWCPGEFYNKSLIVAD